MRAKGSYRFPKAQFFLISFKEGGGAPCIENRGIEDNFIFYIECYFFFIRVRKYKCEFNISK